MKERKGRLFISYHFSRPYSQSAQTWIMQFYLQITPCLPFPCKHSPYGATPNWGSRHPTAAYYSLINPAGMKGWVGLVDWPIADSLPTKWSPVSYRSSAGQKVCRPKTDALSLLLQFNLAGNWYRHPVQQKGDEWCADHEVDRYKTAVVTWGMYPIDLLARRSVVRCPHRLQTALLMTCITEKHILLKPFSEQLKDDYSVLSLFSSMPLMEYCRVAKEHDRWPSSRLNGYRC